MAFCTRHGTPAGAILGSLRMTTQSPKTQMTETRRIPLAVPDLGGREREYLLHCVDDNWVSSAGPFVNEFEAQMAALTNRQAAVATTNGTAALHLALVALGIGVGDEVIVPDWTFAATANAVFHAGATPHFADIDAATWTLDPGIVSDVLGRSGNSVKAVICVHALGHPADVAPLSEICRAHGIPLIEDASGAIGSRYRDAPVGSFGTAACFSFNGNKLVTAGGGGMIVTDDRRLADKARHLSTQARAGTAYLHDAVGWNYRMTNVNAAIGLAQLERLTQMAARKRGIAGRYDSALSGLPALKRMPQANWAFHNCWLYSLLLPDNATADDLVAYLSSINIEARTFWQSLSAQAPYRPAPKTLAGVSRDISGRVVSLPCSSHLTADDQQRVIEGVIVWSGQAAAR
jgi:perosamine synthetase